MSAERVDATPGQLRVNGHTRRNRQGSSAETLPSGDHSTQRYFVLGMAARLNRLPRQLNPFDQTDARDAWHNGYDALRRSTQ